MASSDYKRAYESARKELADLLLEQEKIDKRLVIVRKSLQTFAELCANEGIEIDPSAEAAYLLEHSTLADDIRAILNAHHGLFYRPSAIKDELQRLGHDLSQYGNSQSTIHMVLKRMVQSGDVEEKKDGEGKLSYAMASARERFIRLHKAKLAREKAKK